MSLYGLQPALVEKFHQQGYRSADRALPPLPAANGSRVIDAQQCGKAGLRKPGPLADHLESGGGHLGGIKKQFTDAAVRVLTGRVFAAPGKGLDHLLISDFIAAPIGTRLIDQQAIANDEDMEGAEAFGIVVDALDQLVVVLDHFILPCSGCSCRADSEEVAVTRHVFEINLPLRRRAILVPRDRFVISHNEVAGNAVIICVAVPSTNIARRALGCLKGDRATGGAIEYLKHVIFPCPVGHCPVADETYIAQGQWPGQVENDMGLIFLLHADEEGI